jgi:hypothetical protein
MLSRDAVLRTDCDHAAKHRDLGTEGLLASHGRTHGDFAETANVTQA